jgi:ankyrin repeat protein
MKFRGLALVAAVSVVMSANASAQLTDQGEAFVRAVRDKDADKVAQFLETGGSTVVNARSVNGETGLLIAVARRDNVWTQYLLGNGADPNLAARSGETALMAAARIGFTEAGHWLLSKKARVDDTNRQGETALILAVQGRHAPMVKLLLSQGADPDKTDNAAGYSARDYAKRDTRSPELLKLIEAKKPKR